jgi:hypothetical protein
MVRVQRKSQARARGMLQTRCAPQSSSSTPSHERNCRRFNNATAAGVGVGENFLAMGVMDWGRARRGAKARGVAQRFAS